MNKTKIEWVKNPDGTQGYTHNPLSGCKNHTPEGLCLDGLFPCYAYKLAHGRLKPLYLANKNGLPYSIFEKPVAEELKAEIDPFYPRFWEDRLVKVDKMLKASRKPLGIFPVDMGDWCGIGIPESWSDWILELARRYPQHRFYLLTKQPQRLPEFSPFPDNCWVGVTATTKGRAWEADKFLDNIEAKVKFLSLEPLLDWSPADFGGSFLENDSHINWLIIGACTGTELEMQRLLTKCPGSWLKPFGKKWTLQPPIEWVKEIVEAADQARIKVFLKDNLRPMLTSEANGKVFIESHNLWAFREFELRQEMPTQERVAIPERM